MTSSKLTLFHLVNCFTRDIGVIQQKSGTKQLLDDITYRGEFRQRRCVKLDEIKTIQKAGSIHYITENYLKVGYIV